MMKLLGGVLAPFMVFTTGLYCTPQLCPAPKARLQQVLAQHSLWAKGMGGVRANLSFSYLLNLNLVGVNLRGANLQGINLTGSNLVGADLSGTNMKGATLA